MKSMKSGRILILLSLAFTMGCHLAWATCGGTGPALLGLYTTKAELLSELNQTTPDGEWSNYDIEDLLKTFINEVNSALGQVRCADSVKVLIHAQQALKVELKDSTYWGGYTEDARHRILNLILADVEEAIVYEERAADPDHRADNGSGSGTH